MLAAAGVIVVTGMMNRPAETAPKVSRLPSPTKPLHKPEPQSLLDGSIALTAEQRRRVSSIADDWRREKDRFLTAMARYQPSRGRVDQISGSLQDYSSLSRQLDAARTRRWAAALQILTPDQRHEVQP